MWADGRRRCWGAGDSRAVLCRSGVAIPLTDDHKAAREDETVTASLIFPSPAANFCPPAGDTDCLRAGRDCSRNVLGSPECLQSALMLNLRILQLDLRYRSALHAGVVARLSELQASWRDCQCVERVRAGASGEGGGGRRPDSVLERSAGHGRAGRQPSHRGPLPAPLCDRPA